VDNKRTTENKSQWKRNILQKKIMISNKTEIKRCFCKLMKKMMSLNLIDYLEFLKEMFSLKKISRRKNHLKKSQDFLIKYC